jgi:hypothetical protein
MGMARASPARAFRASIAVVHPRPSRPARERQVFRIAEESE